MGVDESALAAIAERQCGVFSRADAQRHGATVDMIRSRIRGGRWERPAVGVLSFPGHPPSWQRNLWIASINGGASSVVAFEAAGLLHGMSPLVDGAVTMAVDRLRRHPMPGVTWHRIDDIRPWHVTIVDGMRVTTRARTVVDLGAVLRTKRFEEVFEDGITRSIVSVAEVGAVLSEVRRSGKPGVLRVEAALDLLGPGEGLSRSKLERLLDRAIELAGLPEPLREHPLPSTNGMAGFVDRYYPEARWIIEADGRKWHERRRQMARDADRDTEAARRGHLTTRRMWENLDSDPEGSAAALADIYRDRVALFAGR